MQQPQGYVPSAGPPSRGGRRNQEDPYQQQQRMSQPGMQQQGHVRGRAPGEPPTVQGKMSYAEELKLQMRLKKEKEEKDKQERENWEMKKQREIEEYNPWGKGGAGAPLKAPNANPGVRPPTVVGGPRGNPQAASPSPRGQEQSEGPGAFPSGAIPANKVTSVAQPGDEARRKAQEEHQAYLREQVALKEAKKKEEEERRRREEELETQRIAQEQERLKQAFEEEQRKLQEKEENARREADRRKQEVEDKRKKQREEAQAKEKADQDRLDRQRREDEERERKEKEREAPARNNAQRARSPPLPTQQQQQQPRASSPPIPTMRGNRPPSGAGHSNRPPSARRAQSPPLPTHRKDQQQERPQERPPTSRQARPPSGRATARPSSRTRTSSPPLPTQQQQQRIPDRNPDRERGNGQHQEAARGSTMSPPPEVAQDLMEQLKSLRSKLETEQKKVDGQIKRGNDQYQKLQEMTQQRKQSMGKKGPADIFDKVVKATNKAAPVESDGDPLEEFNALKYGKLSSGQAKKDLIATYPEPPSNKDALDSQQRALIHDQQRELERLKEALALTTSKLAGQSRPYSPGQQSLASMTSFNIDAVAARNEELARRLRAAQDSSLGDNPEDIVNRFLAGGGQGTGKQRTLSNFDEVSLAADTYFRPASKGSML